MRFLPALVSTIFFLPVSAANPDTLWLSSPKLHVGIDAVSGRIVRFERQNIECPFRADTLTGFGFEGIRLQREGKEPKFAGACGDIRYELEYGIDDDRLRVRCRIENRGTETFSPQRVRLVLGIDSEMSRYPEWDAKYFPTLLRCERDFAWGYFMSPVGGIVAIATEDPVASYALNYEFEGRKEWLWGHRIFTASLDLLHALPLPVRHPQHLGALAPGESRSWTLHIGFVGTLEQVQSTVARWAQIPQIESDRYTLPENGKAHIFVRSAAPVERFVLTTPEGRTLHIEPRDTTDGYMATTPALHRPGVYRISAEASGKRAEAMLYVHRPWSWYLSQVRDHVAAYPPMFGPSCETFYGYYPAFLAKRHFPDPEKDAALESRFLRTLPQMIDTLRGVPRSEEVLPWRLQNFSTVAGQLVDLWEATGCEKYLRIGSRVGDYISSDTVQIADGSYRANGIHYTAVIYPAKSMFELADAERKAGWNDAARRHYRSAFRACEDLLLRLDDIETEGEMTFEDGMITCSALQMGLAGLRTTDPELRRRYAEAARYMMEKHRCLEQRLIPDCRMRGATLRYWEALDIYFVPNQVMNSPHGWTAWKIYAVYYLYLLTGDRHYLDDLFDTLGAAAQLMSLDGDLRWGFIPDPYVDGALCVPGDEPYTWKTKDVVVGEQYLDPITPWMRPENEEGLGVFGRYGGGSDHTVHEIFKAMEESVLTTGFVILDAEDDVSCRNCSARLAGDGVLHVRPAEKCIARVHVNTSRPVTVRVKFADKIVAKNCDAGLGWVGEDPYPLISAADVR